MNEFEYINPLPEEENSEQEQPKVAPSQQGDPYTYYAGSPCDTPDAQYVPGPKKTRKKQPWVIIAVVALCCSLLSGAMGVGGVLLVQHLQAESEPEVLETTEENVTNLLQGIRENSVIETIEVETGKLMTPAEVYAANVNSTVGIATSVTTNFWGYQSTSAAAGSGFIISDDGYILTNFHVIEDSDSISVSMYNGDSYDATLIGYDESNDIAVLKIEAEGLSPVILGDSNNLNVGDSVVAIGNPLGELTFTLTSGAISAKDREVTMSNNVTMNLLQTDCAINSGNSGGALFNLYGEVVGITNAKYSSGSGGASIDNIGFAIPLNDVWSMVESIIEKGYVSKPYLGIKVVDVSQEMQNYGLPKGAAIQTIIEGGPAETTGLLRNDIITKIDDTEITSSADVIQFVKTTTVGQELKVTIYRQGQTLEITVIVEEQAQTQVQESQSSQHSSQYYPDSIYPFFP